jgi:hypothetical protein
VHDDGSTWRDAAPRRNQRIIAAATRAATNATATETETTMVLVFHEPAWIDDVGGEEEAGRQQQQQHQQHKFLSPVVVACPATSSYGSGHIGRARTPAKDSAVEDSSGQPLKKRAKRSRKAKVQGSSAVFPGLFQDAVPPRRHAAPGCPAD